MKKIILFLLTFILLMTNVNAEEIIKENKKGEYIRKDIESVQYQYVDENDIQYGEYSEYYLYDEQTKLDTPYYDYEVKDVTAYYKSYDIDYVQIKATFGDMQYKTLEVYYDDELITYQIVEEKDSNGQNQTINYNGHIILKLDKSIPADEKIRVTFEVEPMERPLYHILMFNATNLNKPVLKFVADADNSNVIVNPEWGQYMYDTSKEYYSEEEPTGGKLYYSNGLKKCFRYRDILTYRYNIIPEDNINTENLSNSNTISKEVSTTNNESLIDLENYQSINVPNTHKIDLWITIFDLIFGSFFQSKN